MSMVSLIWHQENHQVVLFMTTLSLGLIAYVVLLL
jgi:hypothetical protein